MISEDLYNKIRKVYGYFCSWAVWDKEGSTPKSNMGNLKIFDLKQNSEILSILKNNIIMIGLNFSRPIDNPEPFINFHDKYPYANDFKIRYAFRETIYYGAYMTDIIKNSIQIKSSILMSSLDDQTIDKNVEVFRNEIACLEAKKPTILAFGKDAYDILKQYLYRDEYSSLIKLTHYSDYIRKEDYKKEVLRQISESL